MFSTDGSIKFIRCSRRARDIDIETEAVKQISFYHVRESMHSGIQETFNSMRYKIFYPNLLELIHIVINQCEILQRVIRNYNERFHSTIKCTPTEVQTRTVNLETGRENIEKTKKKYLRKLNEKREDYCETRTVGYVKNYKTVRHKEQPRYRKSKLDNVHLTNIRKKPKFADYDDNIEPFVTEEQILNAEKIDNNGPLDEVLMEKINLRLPRQDITTLLGNSWLNDQIINLNLNLLMERSEQGSLPKVYAMNTFFIPRLLEIGYNGVSRWTRKIDIFSNDFILVPVHVNQVHWCIAIINPKDKIMNYYDPMGNPNSKILEALKSYFKEESMDK
ncbi:sentrin-specific protease 1-like [Hermetia illucens]|uniref:sentrin-specific protease 1-like n=1 Tax=Hermetia illucens TaxID=343691 RepID=UPI0018CC21F1|nr:sentrin-specific protease 1-like [Hermetia illucens]